MLTDNFIINNNYGKKNDNEEIQFVLKEIKKLINIDLKLSETFPVIYETKISKKKYFIIETEKNFLKMIYIPN